MIHQNKVYAIVSCICVLDQIFLVFVSQVFNISKVYYYEKNHIYHTCTIHHQENLILNFMLNMLNINYLHFYEVFLV